MDNTTDDLIFRYLAETLDPETRRAFEQRLAEEPELAARLALEKDLVGALDSTTPENQFRANLQRIAAKYDTPEALVAKTPARSKTRLFWMLATGLILLGGLVFMFLRPIKKTVAPNPVQALEHELSPPAPTLPKQELPEANEVPSISKPIATAYKPLPALESYVGSLVRSDGVLFKVETPVSKANFKLQSGQLVFQFVGKMEGQVPADATYNLLIFNNHRKDFEALKPIEKQRLVINPDKSFRFQKKRTLAPGLYYWIIEEEVSGAWMFVDKFYVN